MDKYEELEKWENVRYRMKQEGIEYCFKHYSSFKEIEDVNFHILRQLLLDTITTIEDKVNSKISELETQISEDDES